jgi:hypothetical protein
MGVALGLAAAPNSPADSAGGHGALIERKSDLYLTTERVGDAHLAVEPCGTAKAQIAAYIGAPTCKPLEMGRCEICSESLPDTTEIDAHANRPCDLPGLEID